MPLPKHNTGVPAFRACLFDATVQRRGVHATALHIRFVGVFADDNLVEIESILLHLKDGATRPNASRLRQQRVACAVCRILIVKLWFICQPKPCYEARSKQKEEEEKTL